MSHPSLAPAVEMLSDLEHQQWMHYATDVMERVEVPELIKLRWQSYMVPYAELSDPIKDLDRQFAYKVLKLVRDNPTVFFPEHPLELKRLENRFSDAMTSLHTSNLENEELRQRQNLIARELAACREALRKIAGYVGASVSVDCSTEFHCQVAEEVRLHLRRKDT